MTNAEIIAKILAEIARLHAEHSSRYEIDEAGLVLERLEDFISDLETSLPAKVADDKGLKVEAVSYCFDNGLNISPRVATDFARHFYGLGCYHTAEKYDEIEYNRQRAEASGSSEIPKDLEEAANEFANQDCVTFISRKNGFIAGAKWQKEQDERIYREFFNERNQGDASFRDLLAYKEGHRDGMEEQKEQMMKEAVEGIVENWSPEPHPEITIPLNPEEYSNGDKVRVIIIKKED